MILHLLIGLFVETSSIALKIVAANEMSDGCPVIPDLLTLRQMEQTGYGPSRVPYTEMRLDHFTSQAA